MTTITRPRLPLDQDASVPSFQLERRGRRADPSWRLMIEAHRIIRGDVKRRLEQFNAADSLTGLQPLPPPRYGVTLSGSTVTLVSHTPAGDGFITDLDTLSPLIVCRLTWGGSNDPSTLLLQIKAHLDPANGGAKNVQLWRCTLYMATQVYDGPEVEIAPIGSPADVVAGDLAAEVTFSFVDQWLRPKGWGAPSSPDGSGSQLPQPTMYVVITALKADGSSATNVGWKRDSTTGSVGSGNVIEARTLTYLEALSRWQDVDNATHGTPYIVIDTHQGFAESILAFTGANKPDLGAVPASASNVVFTVQGERPNGTKIKGEARVGGADAWVEVKDGQTATDVGLAASQTYQMRATLSPTAALDVAPTLTDLGVQEVTRTDLSHIATVSGGGWGFDPVTLKGRIPEVTITAIQDGERDFRDAITDLFSTTDIGDLWFRVYVMDDAISRHLWYHIDDFYPDHVEGVGGALVIRAVNILGMLKQALPKYDAVLQKREKLSYANQTLKAAYSDLLKNQIALADRHIGPMVEAVGTADVFTKEITDSDGKVELDAIAFRAGGTVLGWQGKVGYVDVHGSKGAVLFLGIEDIAQGTVTPGWSQAVPAFFADYDYDFAAGQFRRQHRGFNQLASDKLGQRALDRVEFLDQEIAKGIPAGPGGDEDRYVEPIVNRQVETLGTGMITLDFRTVYAYPELWPGDMVAVRTDRLVAKSPTDGRAIKGYTWVLGVIAERRDIWGTDFRLWVRRYSDILASSNSVTVDDDLQTDDFTGASFTSESGTTAGDVAAYAYRNRVLALPTGLWRTALYDDDSWRLQRNLAAAGDFSSLSELMKATATSLRVNFPLSIAAFGDSITSLPTSGGILAARDGLHVGSSYTAPPVGGIRTEGGIVVEAVGLDVTSATDTIATWTRSAVQTWTQTIDASGTLRFVAGSGAAFKLTTGNVFTAEGSLVTGALTTTTINASGQVTVSGNEFRSLTNGVDVRVGAEAFAVGIGAIGTTSAHDFRIYRAGVQALAFTSGAADFQGNAVSMGALTAAPSVAGTTVGVFTGNYVASGSVTLGKFERIGGAVAFGIIYDDAITKIKLGTTTAHDLLFMHGGTTVMTLTATAAVFDVSGGGIVSVERSGTGAGKGRIEADGTDARFGTRTSGKMILMAGNAVDSAWLTTAAFTPATAGLLTLGTAALPWGNGHMQSTSDPTTFTFYNQAGTVQGRVSMYNATPFMRIGTITAHDWALVRGDVTKLTLASALTTSAQDFAIGSLGTFDSSDTPTEGQLLIYKAGAINKWQAESLNAVWGDTDFKAAILTDGAVTYIFADPGAGADSPVGAPATPDTPIVTQSHGTHTVELRGYAKPADFRQFEWEYDKNSAGVWIALATTTSAKVVHSRLTFDGTTFRYRVRVVDRAGNASGFSTATAAFTPIRTGETHAFGAIIAGEIAVANLAAIKADIGIITAGQLRNTGNTAGVNLGGAGGIPGTWTMGINFEASGGSGSMTRYINFTATGSASFLKTERLEFNVDGVVKMYQSASQPLFKLDASDFLLQNDAASPTQGVLIDGTLPGTWTRYLNLNGSGTMLLHDKLELKYSGTPLAIFKGAIDVTDPEQTGSAGSNTVHVLLRSPDVAHGMTALVPTDVLGTLGTPSRLTGGLEIEGYSEGAQNGLVLGGMTGAAGAAAVQINGFTKSGTGRTAIAVGDPIVSVSNAGTNLRFAVYGDGAVLMQFSATATGTDTSLTIKRNALDVIEFLPGSGETMLFSSDITVAGDVKIGQNFLEIVDLGNTSPASPSTGGGRIFIRNTTNNTPRLLKIRWEDGSEDTIATGPNTPADYVFEHAYLGAVLDRKQWGRYAGLMPLPEVEVYARSHFHLPGTRAGRFDIRVAAEKIEEQALYLFDHERRIRGLETERDHIHVRLKRLEDELAALRN